ncbi:HD domain-containing protein [Foetidibacter luteolus]|uniref:HD domain-containing protein n=1 Tax=Foetidibacter luteolus TaxID=2608880 RepID=UPI00129BDFE0|nr:hypothetical protein [Foetidibacter luteolus]
MRSHPFLLYNFQVYMLKDSFTDIISQYAGADTAGKFWREIESHYNNKKRRYHNINHLQHMLQQLTLVKHLVTDWNSIVSATCYHDIVYKVTRRNNEEKSTAIATERLASIHYPATGLQLCTAAILATKLHEPTTVQDINLFTDADLSILGAPPDVYKQYATGIRKEYALYPDFLYKPGRKKVLQRFLDMPFIFKTKEFQSLYETQARQNIQQELDKLQ